MWNFLARNPEIILFLLVGGASILGRLKKAVEAGQGLGGVRIPPPAEIHRKGPIPTRSEQPATPPRAQPIRRATRPQPARSQTLRQPTPPRKRLPPSARPSPPQPAAKEPKRPVEQPVESSFEARQSAGTVPVSAEAHALHGLFANRGDLRRAILTAEILGRPLALR